MVAMIVNGMLFWKRGYKDATGKMIDLERFEDHPLQPSCLLLCMVPKWT